MREKANLPFAKFSYLACGDGERDCFLLFDPTELDRFVFDLPRCAAVVWFLNSLDEAEFRRLRSEIALFAALESGPLDGPFSAIALEVRTRILAIRPDE